MSVSRYDMVSFYKMIVTIEIGYPPTGFQHNQRSCRIIPFSEKSFCPGIKTSGSYIADSSRSRTIHTDSSNDSIQSVDQMESSLFILLIVVRKLSYNKSILRLTYIRNMNFLAIHKGLSAFPCIETFIPANFINDSY